MKIRKIKTNELKQFILDIQEAFQKGYEDYFGKCEEKIIPEKKIMESYKCKRLSIFCCYSK